MAQHLNLSENQVNNIFLDTADDFLKDYVGNSAAAKVWKATPEFWAWWQQVWVNRDKLILKRYPNRLSAPHTAQLYTAWHNPQMIPIKPNSVVYDAFIRTMKQQNILLKELA